MAKNWYIIHTYSGFEEKVKTSIEEKAKIEGLENKIARILIPTERAIELKEKKRQEVDRKFYPGYILVEMEIDDETWHLVKNTFRVAGFVGGAKPVPLLPEEVEIILQQIEKGPIAATESRFKKGENVRIIDGPFSSFVGCVDEVDMDHDRLRVMVSIFNRLTPVELLFSQVERA